MIEKPVVLLVDGDNISATQAPRLLAEARKLGRLDVARVYGAANHPTDWNATPGFRMMKAGCGKNAADLLLCIDAMELALTHGHQTFVLASSDGDFSHVALRLREGGRHVLGLGEAKAPPAFRAACSAFLQIGEAKLAPAPPPLLLPPTPAPAVDLDRRIREMIAIHGTKAKGMPIVALSTAMSKAHGIQISTLPERTWRNYLAKRPTLFALDPKGPEAMVRFLPNGFGT